MLDALLTFLRDIATLIISGAIFLLETVIPGQTELVYTPPPEPPARQETFIELPEGSRTEDTPENTTNETTPEDTGPTPPATQAPDPNPKEASLSEPAITIQDPETLSPPKSAASTPLAVSDTLNALVRSATVNILCTTAASGALNPISGSGVIIDPSGIILTNAHIAQYFLLLDYPREGFIECQIRTGAPARPVYTAELLYISPAWIRENAPQIDADTARGTGEHDFALLRITNDSAPYPALPVDLNDSSILVGSPVVFSGYPAGFLGGISIVKDLYPTTTLTPIMDRFTFGDQQIDLLSLGGIIAAQSGASGGAIVSLGTQGLVGLVATNAAGETTAERNLHAITLTHINRSLLASIGTTLPDFLSGDTEAYAAVFQETIAPTLTDLLVEEIEN